MTEYKLLSYSKIDDEKTLSVGMWPNTNDIFFTVEGLSIDDILGQDVEFGISITQLKTILSLAASYQKDEVKAGIKN